MKLKFKRIFSVILAIIMILSAFPVTSYAAEGAIGLIELKAKNIDVSHPFKRSKKNHSSLYHVDTSCNFRNILQANPI